VLATISFTPLFKYHSASRTALSLVSLGSSFALPFLKAETFTLEEATIEQIQRAMDAGALSSVELTALYLNRINVYDKHGPKLNAIVVPNPAVLAEAAAADQARAQGKHLGPLQGIPYTVKDSYKVKGLTVAAGSPAFAKLVANEDAFTVAQIRASGGVLIGKTNMPPMANGGMQPGLYGRAESPYNSDYLTAGRGSGSSNGSGSSTGANLAVFGMGEETVSSGRSPSSNNALVAYTPSRGVISIRGNWPLYADKDVAVPMTRTMGDMFALLDVIVAEDPIKKGDFWRAQSIVPLPSVSSVRPASFRELMSKHDALRGKRIGALTCFIGKDAKGIFNYPLRPSILTLWEKAVADLRAQGATVVEIDFPIIHNYHEDTPDFKSFVTRGLLPKQWWRPGNGGPVRAGTTPVVTLDFECVHPYTYEEFLKGCEDPHFPSWSAVNTSQVFPYSTGSIDAKVIGSHQVRWDAVKTTIQENLKERSTIPGYKEWLEGLEKIRKVDFEDWMKENNLDFVAFPSAADIGKTDCETNQESYERANANGVARSSTNSMMRHLGIPSVSVTMGLTSDIGMPVNITFMGAAYSDRDLLTYGYAYEQATHNRRPPSRISALDDETIEYSADFTIPSNKRRETTPPELSIDPASSTRGTGHKPNSRSRERPMMPAASSQSGSMSTAIRLRRP
jgi:amidase